MKKLVTTIATLVVGAYMAFSQGSVNFNNSVAMGDSIDRKVYLDTVGGTPLTGVNWYAALYYGADAASVGSLATLNATDSTLASALGKFRAVAPTTSFAGTWSGGSRLLINAAPGATVFLQVRVWDSSKYASFDLAKAAGGVGSYGQSDAFAYTISTASPVPPSDLLMKNLRAFVVTSVPEPATIALGAVGLASLLYLRRRK